LIGESVNRWIGESVNRAAGCYGRRVARGGSRRWPPLPGLRLNAYRL